MHDLFLYFATGLSVGCAYAAVALGLVVVANVTGVYNFATGDYVMVGGMVMAVAAAAGWPLGLATALSVVSVTGVALLQERLTVAPVRGRVGPLGLAITTVGVSILLRGIVLELWGKDARTVPPYQDGTFHFLGLNLVSQTKWVWLVTIVVLVAVTYLFARTDLGRAMRACAINPIAARLTGIKLGTMSMTAFGLAGALCGLLAAVAGSLTTIQWSAGINIGLIGFIAAALAGFKSPARAVAAGLALGCLEQIAAGDISSKYVQAIVYATLLVYLIGRDFFGADGLISRRLKASRATEPGSESAPELREQVSGRIRSLEQRLHEVEEKVHAVANGAQARAESTARRGGGALRDLPATLATRARARPLALLPVVLLILAWFYPSTISDLGTQDNSITLITAAMAATGLGLIMGLAGQFSLGQAVFMLVSGYTAAILTADHGWGPLAALVVAVAVSAVVGLLVGWITLKLEGLNLALATLAVLVIAIEVVSNAEGLTHGNSGVQNVSGLKLFGHEFNDPKGYFRMSLVILAVMLLISRNVWNSRTGRALRAVGIDQTAAESVGLNALALKLRVVILGAAMAGVGGVLNVYYLRFAAPNSWDVSLTINLVTYLVVGGLFSPYGGALGAAVVGTILYWVSQHVGASDTGGASSWDVVVSGGLLIFFLIVFRRGLASIPELVTERVAAWRAKGTTGSPVEVAHGEVEASASDGSGGEADASDIAEVIERMRPTDPLKTETPLLVVDGLTKRFGGFTAVNDVSFTLRPGYVTALIGPNGAGKSTVINMLSGALLPTEGSIGIMGRPTAGLEPRQIAQLGLARTFQTPRLFEGMMLLETVMLARDPHGSRFWLFDGALRTPRDRRNERKAREEAMAWLTYVGLGDDADVPATSLPVGKQRMAEVARALATEPAILLLDEPAAGLDGTETKHLASEIRTLGDAGIAVLLVEHDMSMVMAIADWVVVLEEGRKIAEGTPDEIRNNQSVIDAYLGVAA